jgi:cation diffusion facilitator CzcD-associated flavoprotein CzcO
METFEGAQFHSSIWNHKFNFKDKNIAVIGSGASAIQFIPELEPQVKNLFVFQRTPNWIMPKADRPFKDWERKLFLNYPIFRKIYREGLYWGKELRVVAFVQSPFLLKIISRGVEKDVRKLVKDPELQKAMIPNYTMGCKRILLANNYYPAIIKENVKVITDGIERISKNSIFTKTGKEVSVDAIIYATGFKATKILSTIHIVGNEGKVLNDVWKENVESYLGTTVAGFPNLFIMVGPNTGVGHTSMIHIIESQAKYVMDGIKYILKNNIKSIDVKKEEQKEFNEYVQSKMKGTVWQSGGCVSWYQDDKGRNPTLWPGFTVKFRRLTRKFDASKYKLVTK